MEGTGVPRKRAIMVITFFGEYARIIMPILAFLVIALGVWNITLYRDLNDQGSRLSGIEIARIVEERSNNRNQVSRCRGSIRILQSFNTLVTSYRSDLRTRADTSRALARNDKPGRAHILRIRAADAADRKANALTVAPRITKATCNKLERRLRAELVVKFGPKLRQLEKEEARSRKSDT
jgi:hypothetical protein